MSIEFEKDNIDYGDTLLIKVYNLKNVYIEPGNLDTVIIDKSSYIVISYYFEITIKPTKSTNYTIYGFDTNNNKKKFQFIIYVNIILDKTNIIIEKNDVVELTAYGSENYTLIPDIYILGNKNNIFKVQPLENIEYTISSTDQFNYTSSSSVQIEVLDNLLFTPNNPNSYEGDLVSIIVSQEATSYENVSYNWRSTKSFELPLEYANITYGNELNIHPFFSVSFIVEGHVNNILKLRGQVYITVLPKPAEILDTEIIPLEFYDNVIKRNVTSLKQNIRNNPIITQKVVKYYNNTITNSYKLEFTNRMGSNLKVPWNAYYNQKNKTNNFIITFKQQWKLYAYINRNQRRQNITISNYAFLLNTIYNTYSLCSKNKNF